MPTLSQPIQTALDALDDRLEDLANEYPDEGDFWAAFAGEVDLIEDAAADADEAREVRRRIDGMMRRIGIAWL